MRTLTYYNCIDCGQQLSYQGHKNKGTRCKSCSTKWRIKQPDSNFAKDGFKKENTYGKRFIKGQPATKWSYKKGHKFTPETILKFRRIRLGVHNSPTTEWRPSKIKKKYREYKHLQTSKYNSWRKKVFFRDDYTCKDCGVVGGKLEAHHKHRWIDFPKERYWVDNGITLCKKCHKKRHRRINK